MLYLVRDGYNCYFSFWGNFCLPPPPPPCHTNSPKNERFKKRKKTPGDIIFLHKCTSVVCYIVPEIWHVTDVIVIFNFGLFFAFDPPNSPKTQTFKKMKYPEIPWRYHHFIHVYQKL